MNDFKNIDRFLEFAITDSLNESTDEKFADKIMREIELEKEFAVQDKKTSKLVYFITAGIFAVIAASGAILIYLLGAGTEGSENTGLMSGISRFFDSISIKAGEILGVSLSGEFVMYTFTIGAAVLIFTLIERLVLKKSLN